MRAEQYENIMSGISEIGERTKRIEVAMYGDKEAGITGAAEKVRKVEKKIGKLEKHQWYERGIIAGIIAVFEYLRMK